MLDIIERFLIEPGWAGNQGFEANTVTFENFLGFSFSLRTTSLLAREIARK